MKAIKIKNFTFEYEFTDLYKIVELWRSKERKLGLENFDIVEVSIDGNMIRSYSIYETKMQIVVISRNG